MLKVNGFTVGFVKRVESRDLLERGLQEPVGREDGE
jgi:hypothetical protein